jgi:hypothetical protein
MSINFISLLVPCYVKPAHHGQTPDTYSPNVVAKFEAALVSRAASVSLQRNCDLLVKDERGDTVRVPHLRYDFSHGNDVATAEIIALALQSFGVERLTVWMSDRAICSFDTEAVDMLGAGLHDWSAE